VRVALVVERDIPRESCQEAPIPLAIALTVRPAFTRIRSVSRGGEVSPVAAAAAAVRLEDAGEAGGDTRSESTARPSRRSLPRRAVSDQNCASRFADTCRRYSAVERRSSIGWISSIRTACASAIFPPPARTASVRGTRTTVGATLPRAIRGRGARTAAMTTFEMAWAARVPTLRNHWRPSTGGISTEMISSSGLMAVCR
jgi:hypothetical protein